MNLVSLDCWFLTGATAVGKTSIGIALARRLGAEIVALDSMTVYRGMDIGTAKPKPAERAAVPHHLIDVVDPADDFSVAQYVAAAREAVAEIRGRGREVLFVGGTPLYLKSLLRGLYEGPPPDWQLRRDIERELADVGERALHERLTQLDPVAATQIHPHDTRRLVRALEVLRTTGEPISHHQLDFEEGHAAEACRVFVLRRAREEQHARIEARVDAMFDEGLIDEVRRLTSEGRELGRTARQAVGYREVTEYLAGSAGSHDDSAEAAGSGPYVAGACDLETARERIKARTRRFAKRQGTWFRSLSECRFVDIQGEPDPAEIAEQIAAAGQHLAGR